MNIFPETPQALLKKIAELSNGADEIVWKELIELYAPALRLFVKLRDSNLPDADVEDVVQEVFIKLVEVLRRQAYDNARGRFRAYLAVMVRRILVDRYRRRMSRPDMDAAAAIEELDREAGSPDAGTVLDAKWRLACHIAAERHVLEKSAISDQSSEVYRLSSVEGLSNGQIAKRLGLKENAVRRIKSRVAAMVESIERTLYE